jgi:predicted nuclease with TOPRIM domain
MGDTQTGGLVAKAGFAAAAAVLMGMLAHAGQAAPPAKTEDMLPALLEEVKGLRAAMEQMASAGPRVQLFVGRLQLQESRMNGMIRRLESVHDKLETAQEQLAASQDTVKRTETALASPDTRIPREELTQMLSHTKREVEERKGAVARLAAEEAQLTQDLTLEQGRWTDINQRLDELERVLAKR